MEVLVEIIGGEEVDYIFEQEFFVNLFIFQN